jgi:two-component system nitrate/nitrite response regulator NarL
MKEVMMADLRVAIVDEHPILREGVQSAIERQSGFAFVASGSEAAHVIEILKSHDLDVLLVDVCVAGDAFQAIADAASAAPKLTIVIFTGSLDPISAVRGLRAGADAYVLKSSSFDELFYAVNMARGGHIFISKSIEESVVWAFGNEDDKENGVKNLRSDSRRSFFSKREIQIIKLLFLGKKNIEIAAALSLSERTIKFYISQLMTKLDARSRVEIVVFVKQDYPEILDG